MSEASAIAVAVGGPRNTARPATAPIRCAARWRRCWRRCSRCWRRCILFSIFLLALGQSPDDFLDVDLARRVRQLVLHPQHAAPRRAVAADRAVRGSAGPAWPGDHRRRGRGGAGRPRRHRRRAALMHTDPIVVQVVMAVAGAGVGALWIGLSGALRAKLGVNEIDRQPGAGLYRPGDLQSSGRGRAARSGQPEQAVHLRHRRRQHAGQRAVAGRASRHSGRHRCLRAVLGADLPHQLRLRRTRHRRQHARGAVAGTAGGAADHHGLCRWAAPAPDSPA